MPINKYFKWQRYDSHPELPIDPDVERLGKNEWPPIFHASLMASVFVGGCGGAYARYTIAEVLPTSTGGWPAATLFVNLLGAFALGFLLEGLARLGKDSGLRQTVRLMLGTGFIGAFTTYSTFGLDIHTLILNHHITVALTYLIVTIAGGILLSALGIQVASKHRHARQRVRS